MRLSWLALASLCVGAACVVAQGLSSVNITSAGLIPQNLSNDCNNLLTQLDQDSIFQTCTKPLINAAVQYANESAHQTNQNQQTLYKSLEGLCRDDNPCDRPLVRHYISSFWERCADDMEGNDSPQLRQLYDYVYMFIPFRDAVCSEDQNNNYCVESLSSAHQEDAPPDESASSEPAPSKRSLQDQFLVGRSFVPPVVQEEPYEAAIRAAMPSSNASKVLNATSQAFLFLSPSSPRGVLCSHCSSQVLANYVKFELASPYALGTKRSSALGVQSEIFDQARQQCGDGFIENVNRLAGADAFSKVFETQSLSGATHARPRAAGALLVLGLAAYLFL